MLKRGDGLASDGAYPAFAESCLDRSNGNRVRVVLQLVHDGGGNPYLRELRF